MASDNPLRDLASFAYDTKYADLPPDVAKITKLVLLDSVGCMLGAQTIDKGKEYIALLKRLGGNPEATIFGEGDKVSLSTAALINAELMFTLDFHNIMSNAHDGAYIIPTLLAFGESYRASGKDLITAAATSCEISSRLAMAFGRHPYGAASQPRPQPKPGEPPPLMRTGNAHSNLAAAAGASRLAKMDQEKMVHAMGMAGHLCGVLTYGRWGAHNYNYMFKYGVPGWQETGAVMAVLLAEMGYWGDTYVLDDERGFAYFTGYTEWHPEKMLPELGSKWWFIHRLHFKPYPCCGAFHCALDCFYDILDKENIAAGEIEEIHLCQRGPGMATRVLTSHELENPSAAQFNPPFLFSVAANRITIGPEWHDKATIRNPNILGMMDKLKSTPFGDFDPELTKDPLSALAKVEVVARGKTFSVMKNHRRGTLGTEVAPTDETIINKFKHNAERILTQDKIDKAVEMFLNLEKLDNIGDIFKIVTR